MALFKPIKSTAENIANLAKKDGQFLFATDTGAAFVDINNTIRAPLRSADSGFTFVVDSNDALAAWANNTAGNNYTSVLIKPGTWTSSKEVNLTTANTKVVQGMPGSLLSFTSTYGLRYPTRPTSTEYWMKGVNISLSAASYGYGFYNCTNLTSCTGTGTGSESGNGYGFYGCTNLTSCAGKGSNSAGGAGYGFCNCRVMMLCRPNSTSKTATYITCYMHNSGTTDPVADTAAGGWNRS
jgi:hypothetical protein